MMRRPASLLLVDLESFILKFWETEFSLSMALKQNLEECASHIENLLESKS